MLSSGFLIFLVFLYFWVNPVFIKYVVPRFSSTNRQVNPRCWELRCRNRTPRIRTGDRPEEKTLFPHFIFPWFYFLHFAEFCPKKTVGLLIAIPIMIRFTTSSALAGKPVAARPRLQACLGGFSRKLRN